MDNIEFIKRSAAAEEILRQIMTYALLDECSCQETNGQWPNHGYRCHIYWRGRIDDFLSQKLERTGAAGVRG